MEKNMVRRFTRRLTGVMVACVAAAGLTGVAQAADITGAGATFPYPIYAKWAEAYKAKTNIGLNYQSIGSGGGIKQITAQTVDFGASDKFLADKDLAAAPGKLIHIPTVMGAVVVTYNIPGVAKGLKLSSEDVADIYLGKITTWNDPAIQKLNAGANLPAEPIHVVFRNDQSGTTDNFQEYLDAASDGAWGKGAGKMFNGGVGEGAKGNDGTSAAIKATEGSITYNEWSFAQAQKLNMAKIVTSAGPDPVAISADSVGKTISGATIKGQGNDMVINTLSFYKPTQAGSYPIVLATYEIVCSKYPDSQVGTAVKAFLQSAIGAGQNGLANNGYIPIPDAFKSRLSTSVNAIS